ncbi:RpiB/LacA/LacB family sugar-phosphate isomerase [Alkalibacter saccharofermentans]|jgi:ribose 5-phosphate isomerase B|uniref:Ribose 5-phosphate isomerase B n=1 Tax=Alkalibacter saccharofermentans DSM 14828 TaxID=1120975 RepID=A0A1M4T7N9_9FIRM|nr:RpiB/LacA/LacB family sugar-phosphate isomerase [Alkalibacter saccharofermentans]SHE40404.1 ribose 5-phosphate isomerase B [Alkalibacter saccharofermentans DSM 14828]
MKKIAIGSDHAAFQAKINLIEILKSWDIEVVDVGPDSGENPVEYVPIAESVALKVANKEVDGGILMCGTGVGMSVAANKIPGIRASVVNDLFTAQYSKSDVDLNVLCMGARVISERIIMEITKKWIETPFTGGRFIPRIAQLHDMESKYLVK